VGSPLDRSCSLPGSTEVIPDERPVLFQQPILSAAQSLCGACGPSQVEVVLPQWGSGEVGTGFCLSQPQSYAAIRGIHGGGRCATGFGSAQWCFEWLAGGSSSGAPLGGRSHRRPTGNLPPLLVRVVV